MNISSLVKLLFGCIFVMSVISCSYKPYNPDSPDAYFEYWCDPQHRKNSLAIRMKNGATDELEGLSEAECFKRYREYNPEKR